MLQVPGPELSVWHALPMQASHSPTTKCQPVKNTAIHTVKKIVDHFVQAATFWTLNIYGNSCPKALPDRIFHNFVVSKSWDGRTSIYEKTSFDGFLSSKNSEMSGRVGRTHTQSQWTRGFCHNVKDLNRPSFFLSLSTVLTKKTSYISRSIAAVCPFLVPRATNWYCRWNARVFIHHAFKVIITRPTLS